MKPAKRGTSLFDVMSKAPIASSPRTRPKPSWFQRKVAAPVLSVAEPLTEEQAAEALAQEPVAVEAVKPPKPAKLKAPPEPVISEPSSDEPSAPVIRASNGRLIFNLSTAACVAVVGVIATIALTAYVLGQRSSANRLPPVAARSNGQPSVASPLLPAPTIDPKPSKSKAAVTNPDLSHLLQRPGEPTLAANANKPARVSDDATNAQVPAGAPENLNYLQIESFRITRERSGDQLAQDVAAARKFLQDRGVRTFARKRGNGFVLFAEQGFAPGKASAKERAAFKGKIEQFGQEYKSAGGQYQFKGCLFVSYSSTRAGDPV